MRRRERAMSGPKPHPKLEPYKGPAGVYGSVGSVTDILVREGTRGLQSPTASVLTALGIRAERSELGTWIA